MPRAENLNWTGNSENQWGFGQLVPLILLIQPLGAVAEGFYPGKAERRRQQQEWNDELEKRSQQARDTSARNTAPCPDASHGSAINQRRHRFMHCISQDDPAGNVDVHEAVRSKCKETFYNNRIFILLCWLLQVTIAGAAAAALYFDYLTIGNGRSDNWENTVLASVAYIGISFLITFALLPFSGLGKWDDNDFSERHRDRPTIT